eukprot:m.349769 g.349769  ORF g.349769 m.349769 type:complete len:60 (+) comp43864_c0_seq1:89-268(+)
MAEATAGASSNETLSESDFVTYLRDIVPLMIGGSEGELDDVLGQPASLEILKKLELQIG